MIATAATGTLTRKIEPHEKCSSSQPPVIGPAATPTPTMAAHSPMALARFTGSVKMLVISPRVVGKMTAAPTPIAARAAIRPSAVFTWAATADVIANSGEAGAEPAPSAVAVGQAARRQQQAGHDQGVGVDDPLQLRGVGVEFARQRGQGDVDDGGVDADDEDAQADDRKRGDRVIFEDRGYHPLAGEGAGTHGQNRKPFRQYFQV